MKSPLFKKLKRWSSCLSLTRKRVRLVAGSVVVVMVAGKIKAMEIFVDQASEKQFTRVDRVTAPKFLDPNEVTVEMRDPDYRLKLLMSRYPGMNTISCSKCHHCR